MDIREAISLREELEKKIQNLLNEYVCKTGLKVEDVFVSCPIQSLDGCTVANLNFTTVDISIPRQTVFEERE